MAIRDLSFYLNAAANDVAGEVVGHPTRYFSAPQSSLDERLFTTTGSFNSDWRSWVLSTLYDYWSRLYLQPERWSTVWVAGSAITYQWASDDPVGDLDILIGVDWPKFFRYNPDYRGMTEKELASILNQDLHDNLWQERNGFDVTFYVNEGATDIRDIRPYAAYNLTEDTWTVKPPEVSSNPRSDHPTEYWDAVSREQDSIRRLLTRFNAVREEMNNSQPYSPAWHNAMTSLEVLAKEANDLYDDIHLGRKQAFSPLGGEGYGDYYNFRWQAHKEAGTVQALREIRKAYTNAQTSHSVDLYGRRLPTADEVRTQAALWASRNRGM